MQCKLEKTFHIPQSTVHFRIFSKLEGNGAQFTVSVCHDAPQFFFSTHVSVFLEQGRTDF